MVLDAVQAACLGWRGAEFFFARPMRFFNFSFALSTRSFSIPVGSRVPAGALTGKLPTDGAAWEAAISGFPEALSPAPPAIDPRT